MSKRFVFALALPIFTLAFLTGCSFSVGPKKSSADSASSKSSGGSGTGAGTGGGPGSGGTPQNPNATPTPTVTPTSTPTPSPPTTLTLQSPASSPSTVTTPTIRVGGVIATEVVKLYSDAGCVTLVATGAASGTTLDLVSSPLTAATYAFHATATAGGLTSACSTATVAYTVNPPPGFTDHFTANTLDARWVRASDVPASSTYNGLVGVNDPNVSIAPSGGQLVLLPPSVGNYNYNAIETVHHFNFTDASFSVDMAQGTDPNYFHEVGVEVLADAYNGWVISVAQGVIHFFRVDSGQYTDTQAPYSQTTHRFIRIRHNSSAHLIYFETSPDRTTWTVQRSTSCDYDASDVKLGFYDGGNSTSVSTAKIDDVTTDAVEK